MPAAFWKRSPCRRKANRDRAGRLLFEGAQGLLLDQDRGFFPHVTRSNTGLRNVLTLADEWGLERLEVTYVTRAYLTRHGAGPLPHELPDKPYPGVVMPPIVPNAYPGIVALRLAGFGFAATAPSPRIWPTRTRLPTLAVHPRLAITCLDQIGDEKMRYYREREATTRRR
jgi:adenylosuccinate synthase